MIVAYAKQTEKKDLREISPFVAGSNSTQTFRDMREMSNLNENSNLSDPTKTCSE